MMNCRICGKQDCDDDCEELALIFREQQREKFKDVAVAPDECCVQCGDYLRGGREVLCDACLDESN